MSLVYILLFCDVHVDKGATLNLLQYLRVICGCKAIQTNRECCDTTGTASTAYVAIVTTQARLQYSLNALVNKIHYPVTLILEFQRTHTLCTHFQSTARAAITALQLLVFCTAHTCLASLSSLMEAEPEIPSAAHVYK